MSPSTPSPLQAELERIEAYLASDPRNPHLLATAIDLSLSLGRLDAARVHADAAVAALPQDAGLAHKRGQVLVAQGQLDDAAAALETLLAQVPNPHIACNLAWVRFRQGRHAQVCDVLAPFMADGSASVPGVTLFIRSLHQLGDVAGAVEAAQGFMARCGRDAEFLAAASLAHLDHEQLDEAQRLAEAALASGQRPLEALVARGSVALAHDDAATAQALFEEATAAIPSDGRSWAGLGMASLLQGRAEEASTQLARATVRMPAHIGTWHALGWCQITRHDLPAAQQAFQKALDLDRNFGESHGGLAVVHALQGDAAAAQDGIARALRLDPQSLSAQYARMVLSGATRDAAQFRKHALRVLSLRPGPAGGTLADALIRRTH